MLMEDRKANNCIPDNTAWSLHTQKLVLAVTYDRRTDGWISSSHRGVGFYDTTSRNFRQRIRLKMRESKSPLPLRILRSGQKLNL